MLIKLLNVKNILTLISVILFATSCKQSELYEKQDLNIASREGTPSSPTDSDAPASAPSAKDPLPSPIVIDDPIIHPIPLPSPVVINDSNTTPIPLPSPIVTTEPAPLPSPVVINDPNTTPIPLPSPIVTSEPAPLPSPVVTNIPGTQPSPIAINYPKPSPSVTPPQDVLLNDRIEFFTQKEGQGGGQVDILWVIDDSGSMGDEQEALARNFNLFINQFIERNVDFKMAITTTDGTSIRNGKMVGDSSRLTSASARGNRTAFINNFSKWVQVGTRGSGIEQGLATSAAFIDRYSASFLRKNAYFVVVYISDEEDQSDRKIDYYLNKILAVKENKGLVKAYSIVTVKNYGNRWESIGSRYMKVSEKTAGEIRDIKTDFADTLLKMGGNIIELLDSFALAEAPYQNKIEVIVNNIKVNSGVSFDPIQRTIKFDNGHIPKAGEKIEVRYKVEASVIGAL